MPAILTFSRSLFFRVLSRSSRYRAFRGAFRDVTQLDLHLEPGPGVEAGPALPAANGEASAFCREVNRGASCLRCRFYRLPSDAQVESEGASGTCAAGFQTTVIPVPMEAAPLAWLVTGQVAKRRPSEPAYRVVEAQLGTLFARTVGASSRRAFFSTRVIEEARYRRGVALLSNFARQVRGLLNGMMIETSAEDTFIVARVKELLRREVDHGARVIDGRGSLTSELRSLPLVFEEETGICIEEFVTRCRIETARRALLADECSIDALAARAGYGNPVEFDRDFIACIGESPAEHRRKAIEFETAPMAPRTANGSGRSLGFRMRGEPLYT